MNTDKPVNMQRGSMILLFGMLGLAIYPFAIAAWLMGTKDAKAMRASRTNSGGFSPMRIGLALGWIGVVGHTLVLLILELYLLFIALFLVAGHQNP